MLLLREGGVDASDAVVEFVVSFRSGEHNVDPNAHRLRAGCHEVIEPGGGLDDEGERGLRRSDGVHMIHVDFLDRLRRDIKCRYYYIISVLKLSRACTRRNELAYGGLPENKSRRGPSSTCCRCSKPASFACDRTRTTVCSSGGTFCSSSTGSRCSSWCRP